MIDPNTRRPPPTPTAGNGPPPGTEAGFRAPPRPLVFDRNLLIIVSITFAAVMGSSSITPALPPIARAFGISTAQVGWLISVFTLPGILLTPVSGMLADRYGRKRILVPSLLLFAAAGGACAFAANYEQLLLLRALQGVGASSLGAINVTLIGDIYSGNRRATAMGYNGAMYSVGAAGYPLLSGLLTLVDWRIVFALPLIAVPIALCVGLLLRNPEPERFDTIANYLGKLFTSVGNREVAAMFVAALVAFALLFGTKMTYLPFLLEADFGSTSAEIGLVIAVSSAGSGVGSVFLGLLNRLFSRKAVLIWAFAGLSATVAVVPYVPALWMIVVSTTVFGASHAISIAMVQVLLSGAAATEQRGAVMALNGMMFRTGQTAGPLMMGLFLAFGGMDFVFVGSALLGLTTILLLVIALPGKRRPSA